MKVLVVGGAGYIGSHMVRLLVQHGHEAIVFDNLSAGHRNAVDPKILVVGEMSDQGLVEKTIRDHGIDSVMHFAAHALVGESVEHPAKYYDNNTVATFRLLEAMRATGVQRFVFSSTCATYGAAPDRVPIRETEKQEPINPYGFTKLVVEHMLADYAHAYGLGFAALRYFNAAGASPQGDIGEDHDPECHLIPLVLQVALGQRSHISIFGDDYDTADGTCIRDYIHVDDLGRAHLLALERLESGKGIQLNLGTGRGNSVQEVIRACREVTGHEVPSQLAERRPGDPPELVADASKAKAVLGWTPSYLDLNEIVSTAWKWHQSHPNGYGS